MRYFLLILGIFVSGSLMAQTFTYSVKAGVNATNVRVIDTDYPEFKYSNNIGWQAGANVEYMTGFQFYLYTGAGLTQRGYQNYKVRFDTLTTNTYRPMFLAIPFGIGYRMPLSENYSLKLFGGTNVHLGLGGKITTDKAYYAEEGNNEYKLVDIETERRDIRYGDRNRKTTGYDYAIGNWGFQFGTAIELNKIAELEFQYHVGLNNFLPGKKSTPEIQKMNIVEANIKIDFPNAYFSKHLKK